MRRMAAVKSGARRGRAALDAGEAAATLSGLVRAVAQGDYVPVATGAADFQLTRGLLGVST